MKVFDKGETVICSVIVRDNNNALKDPATSMNITITSPDGVDIVDDQAMTKDSTGNYHYDYTSLTTASSGTYTAKYIATDGARVTIEKETFGLG